MADAPTPSDDVPDEVQSLLDSQDPATLRAIADYASTLAANADSQSRGSADTDDEEIDDADEQLDERDADIPSKASIVTKTINDNKYYYWQWRDGDKIKSKYKGPVNPSDDA